MKLFWLCFIAVILFQDAQAVVKIMMVSKPFVEPCDPKPGEIPIGDVLDLSGLNEMEVGNGTIIRNGLVKFKIGIPKEQKLKIFLSAYRKVRGSFVPTPYVYVQKDFCRSVFEPNSHLYMITKYVAEADRVCPPKVGSVYHIEEFSNRAELGHIIQESYPVEMKVVAKFSAGNFKTCAMCAIKVYEE